MYSTVVSNFALLLLVLLAISVIFVFVLFIKRKQIEKQYFNSEDRYKKLASLTNEAIVIYQNGIILDANDKAAEIFGYSLNEVAGSHLLDYAPFETKKVLEKNISRLEALYYEVELQKKNKEKFYAEIRSREIIYRGEKAKVAIVNDITIRKADDEQAVLYFKKLVKSNQELDQFAYIISHDLQEPIRGIYSFLDLFKSRYIESIDDKGKEYLTWAMDSTNRLQNMIVDLLSYSRVKVKEKSFEEVELNSIVQLALDNLRMKIEDKKAVIKVDNFSPKIYVDKSQLVRLFQNLVGNALKFVKDKSPQINISVIDDNDCWKIAIEDNGVGIDSDSLDEVFAVFKRVHKKEGFTGSGIGLAVSKKIVERHDGKIWVESVRDKGSIFYFTLKKGIG